MAFVVIFLETEDHAEPWVRLVLHPHKRDIASQGILPIPYPRKQAAHALVVGSDSIVHK